MTTVPRLSASQGRAADGVHGLGGVSFQGSTGASSHFVLKADHSFVEVQFWRQPDGGKLDIRAGGQTIHSIETAGAVKEPAFETVSLPPGTRERQPRRLVPVARPPPAGPREQGREQ